MPTPQAAGTEFLVNTATAGNKATPAVAPYLPFGPSVVAGFVVTWESAGNVFGQRHDADGTKAEGGAQIAGQIQVTTGGGRDNPAVAGSANGYGGQFAVVWESDGRDDGGFGGDTLGSDAIYRRNYNADGTSHIVVQVNTHTNGDQDDPAIARLTDGGYVVTWVSDGQDGAGVAVYAQRHDAGYGTTGTEFRVNTTTANSQDEPAIGGVETSQ